MSAKETISENVCRLCLCETGSCCASLFQDDDHQPTGISILQTIEDLLTIKINRGDGLPSCVCSRCCESLSLLKEFKAASLHSQTVLRNQQISRDTAHEIISNTLPMCKVYLRKLDEMIENDKNVIPKISKKSHIKKSRYKTKRNIEDTRKSIRAPSFDSDEFQDTQSNESVAVAPPKTNIVFSSTGKRKYERQKLPCEVCGKFFDKTLLMEHINAHNGIRNVKCLADDCESYFAGNNSMRKHYRLVHTDCYRHQCTICQRKFKTTSSLYVHISYHNEPKLACTVCGTMRNTRVGLKKHMMTHTGERPYQCELCPKAFQNKYNLRVHMRIHTKEKPFACDKCGVTFGYNSLLKAHTEKHHPELI